MTNKGRCNIYENILDKRINKIINNDSHYINEKFNSKLISHDRNGQM